MPISWDWIITLLIILGLVLAIWARISGMTIPELLREIKEFFGEMTEGKPEEVVQYD